MKFDDFDLDLTKIGKGYGVNPLDNGEAPDTGGISNYTRTCVDIATCGFPCWLASIIEGCK